MPTGIRRATTVVALVCLAAMAGCGEPERPVAREDPEPVANADLAYREGLRLRPSIPAIVRKGPVRVRKILYTTVDGQRVPALFAAPARRPAVGCLIYVGRFGETKEEMQELREGLAALGLATFAIDQREIGERGNFDGAAASAASAEGFRSLLLGTVADVRVAIDYLKPKRWCRNRVAVMGTEFGAVVSALVAAQDRRVGAAVLTSIGATFENFLLVRPPVPGPGPQFVPDALTNPQALASAVETLSPYDPERWIGKIAPRPVMVLNGRFDPGLMPADALELMSAARRPRALLFYNGGGDPFADGPAKGTNSLRVLQFLVKNLKLQPQT